jgi:type VI secretion system (T6SS) effector Hcp
MGFVRVIRRPWRAIVLVAIGLMGGAAAFALASIPDDGGVIHGCVLLSDPPPGGQPLRGANLHVNDGSSTTCGSSEEPISWNVTGPQGPAGPAGPTGETGAAGAPGPGVTVASPPIKNSAAPVATLTLGSGRGATQANLLGFGLATASGQASKVNVHDISITKKVDKASPILIKACAKGKHYDTATITARKAGKGQQEFLTITMKDVLISSVQDKPSGGGGKKPQEAISLNFTKIEFSSAAGGN